MGGWGSSQGGTNGKIEKSGLRLGHDIGKRSNRFSWTYQFFKKVNYGRFSTK